MDKLSEDDVFLHRKPGETQPISGIILCEKFVDFFVEKCIIWIRMDTLIKRGFLGPDSLRNLSDHQLLVGTKQLKKALNRGSVSHVLLARDADPRLTEDLERLCLEKGVSCHWIGKMSDLGSACGIEVGAAAAALVPRNL